MTAPSLPLYESQSCPFDAQGNASVFMGPARAGQTWHVTRYVTACSDSANTGVTFTIYKNGDTPSSQIDSTPYGVSATGETSLDVLEGERITGVWSGGTPNTWASLNLIGTQSGY